MSKLSEGRELLENDGVQTEQSADPHLADLLRLRKKLRVFIRQAEKQLLEFPNQRNAYTVIALYTQYREVITEIRSIENQNRFGELVYNKVLSPAFNDVFQAYSDSLFVIMKVLRQELGDEGYRNIKERYEQVNSDYGKALTDIRNRYRVSLEQLFSTQ